MELINEVTLNKGQQFKSAINFELLRPERFLSVIDEMKSAKALFAFSVDEKDCVRFIHNPFDQNQEVMFAGFLARCYTAFEFISKSFGLAKVIRNDNEIE